MRGAQTFPRGEGAPSAHTGGGRGMRAEMLDTVCGSRLAKTKSFCKSLIVPQIRLSPEFHSHPFGAPSPRERGYAPHINDKLYFPIYRKGTPKGVPFCSHIPDSGYTQLFFSLNSRISFASYAHPATGQAALEYITNTPFSLS